MTLTATGAPFDDFEGRPDPHAADVSAMVIVEFPPDQVFSPPGARKVDTASPEFLMLRASMEENGQLVPGIVYKDPITGKLFAADGNHRLTVQRLLGRAFKAYMLDHPPTDSDLVLFRSICNAHRKNPSPYELAQDISLWMDLESATQAQAAKVFGLSTAQISKLLSKLQNACEEVRRAEEEGKVVADVGRMIATLPKDDQPEALRQAVSGNMSRDAVERMVAELKGKKRPKSEKPIKIALPGGAAAVIVPTTPDAVIAAFELFIGAIKRMEKHKLSWEALPGLVKAG